MPSDHPVEVNVAEIRRLLPLLGVDAERRRAAFDALLAMGKGAVRPILQLTRKTGKLAFRENGTNPIEFQDNLKFLLIDFGEPAVLPLIDELKSDAAILKPLFATVLGQSRDPRAIDPLIGLLDTSPYPGSREYAAKALQKFRLPRVHAALASHENDSDENVRMIAKEAIWILQQTSRP